MLGPKKGRGPTATPRGLGSQNPNKKLTHLVDLLGHPLSRNHLSNFSDLAPPLLKFLGFQVHTAYLEDLSELNP